MIVHLDQTSEQVLVQAAHAAAEAGSHFLEPGSEPPAMAILGVPDEPALLAWRARAESEGVRSRLFHEPDFGPLSGPVKGHHTAFATEPVRGELRRVFHDLKPVRFRKGVVR